MKMTHKIYGLLICFICITLLTVGGSCSDLSEEETNFEITFVDVG